MIHQNMSDGEYVRWLADANGGNGAATYTSLSRMQRSPARAVSRSYSSGKRDSALIFGNFFHDLLLRPEVVASRYVIEDYEASRREAINQSGLERVSRRGDNSQDMAINMIRSIRNHGVANQLVTECDPEVSISGEIGGVVCKARLDAVKKVAGEVNGQIQEAMVITDIKSVSQHNTASEGALQRHILDNHYHLQAAVFTTLAQMVYDLDVKFILMFIEKEPFFRQHEEWHGIKLIEVSGDMLQVGIEEMNRLLAQFKACVDAGWFHDYDEAVQSLDLPSWYKVD